MNESFNPYADSPQPSPPDGSRRWNIGRMPRMAVAGGVVAGLVLGGTGIGLAVASATSGGSAKSAAAASSTTTTVPGTKPAKPAGPHGPFGRMRGPLGFGALGGFGGLGAIGGLGPVVHGTITTHSGSGYKTIDYQTGTVSKVSSTSITVASPDGYTHTYAVVPQTIVNAQAGGISSVAVKDSVRVIASPSGSKDTVNSIVDTTKLKGSRQYFGYGGSAGPGGPGAPGAPPSNPSTGSAPA